RMRCRKNGQLKKRPLRREAFKQKNFQKSLATPNTVRNILHAILYIPHANPVTAEAIGGNKHAHIGALASARAQSNPNRTRAHNSNAIVIPGLNFNRIAPRVDAGMYGSVRPR